MSFNCEACKYTSSIKAHYVIHCTTKKHCQLVGTEWVDKPKEIKEKPKENKLNELELKIKEQDMIIQNMKLVHEIELLKQQLKYQEELSTVLLTEKDKMIDYLMKSKEVQHQVSQPQVSQPQVSQPQPQVSQPQLQVPQKELKEEDDSVINKKYLQKHCTTDIRGFCSDIEILDTDYEYFMSGEFIPLKKSVLQILERNLKRITLHEMGVVVLKDKVYTHLEEWVESTKGLHEIRRHIAKEIRLYLLEDETYINKDKMGDSDFPTEDLPTTQQMEQYNDVTQVLLQLEHERHDLDKEIKEVLKQYSK